MLLLFDVLVMKCLAFRVCLVVLPIIQIRKATWSSMPSQAAVCGRRPCGYGFWDVSKFSTKKLQILPTQHLDLRDYRNWWKPLEASFLKPQRNKDSHFGSETRFVVVRPVGGAWCAWLHAGLSNDARWGGSTLDSLELNCQLWILTFFRCLWILPFRLVHKEAGGCRCVCQEWRDWIFDVWWWPTKRGVVGNQAIQFLDEGQLATQQLL